MSEYTCDVGEVMCEVCAYLPTPVFGISGSWTRFPWIFGVFPGQLYVAQLEGGGGGGAIES